MGRRTLSLGLVLALPLASSALAQESGDRNEDLAQTAANPIADLISLPLQFNDDMGLGPYDRSFPVLNVQPVVPIAGGRLVTRTVVPFV